MFIGFFCMLSGPQRAIFPQEEFPYFLIKIESDLRFEQKIIDNFEENNLFYIVTREEKGEDLSQFNDFPQ
jgi:hypothetical protein